ncbi:MAG TPA: hypothetical protein VK638_47675 [Edaphobacter sp.]|nr:hypothetical protein [Edaphobacter sp.]
MKTNNEATKTANDPERTVDADAKQAFTELLAVMREQEKRLDRLTARQDQQDQINVMQQNANALLGEALKGHQQIIEADHPSKPTPPGPPPIVH